MLLCKHVLGKFLLLYHLCKQVADFHQLKLRIQSKSSFDCCIDNPCVRSTALITLINIGPAQLANHLRDHLSLSIEHLAHYFLVNDTAIGFR